MPKNNYFCTWNIQASVVKIRLVLSDRKTQVLVNLLKRGSCSLTRACMKSEMLALFGFKRLKSHYLCIRRKLKTIEIYLYLLKSSDFTLTPFSIEADNMQYVSLKQQFSNRVKVKVKLCGTSDWRFKEFAWCFSCWLAYQKAIFKKDVM